MKKQNKKIRLIKKEWKNIIFNCIFALLTISIPIILQKKIILATVLLSFLSIIGLIKWKSKLTLAIFIFGALWGALSEIIAIGFGVWNYSFINFINIPTWLFIVWGNAAVFIYQTAIEFERLGLHK